jgi:phage terminase large subunit-like protein
LDFCWLFCGGRGTGKSKSLSGAVHTAVRAGIKRMNFIAPTTADFHDVNLEGASGIMATCGHDPPPRWVASHRRLEWSNGARLRFYTAEEPESLRGHEAEIVLVDEIGRMKYQSEVFDMSMLGLRLGDKPRMIIATTPRTTPFLKRLITMKGVSITTGSTYDNAKHLAPAFLAKVRELYEGTRLGRQELQGAMILDPENALFKDSWLVHHEVPEDLIEQVTVGVDPSGGGDEIGIVVCALLTDGRYAILADRTVSGSPATWGEAVVRAHDDFDADDCTVEINYGGVMAAEVVRQTAERLHHLGDRSSSLIRVKDVNASRGKVLRAEPVSLLYEKGRVLHRRGLDQLEAEMLSFSREWDRAVDGSPNRLDAAVWGLTRLSKIVVDIPIA